MAVAAKGSPADICCSLLGVGAGRAPWMWDHTAQSGALSHSCPQFSDRVAPGGFAGWLDLLHWWPRPRSACDMVEMKDLGTMPVLAYFCLDWRCLLRYSPQCSS